MFGSKKLITSKDDEFLQWSNYQANSEGKGWTFNKSKLLQLQGLQLRAPETARDSPRGSGRA